MKTRLVLTLFTTALAFVSVDVWGQCYTAQGCELPEHDLATSTKGLMLSIPSDGIYLEE